MPAPQQLWDEARARGLPDSGWLLVVDTASQRLAVWHAGRCVRSDPVSTSKHGAGEQDGSRQTPRGWHEVAERIGGGAPLGQVFEGRVPTEEVLRKDEWSSLDDADRILTRILRLRGLEAGTNRGGCVDSYDRFIYIHGTDHEHLLGRPASHGCVRMANEAIFEIFDEIGADTAWCWIGVERTRRT